MVKTIVTQGHRLPLDPLELVDVDWINSVPHDTNLFQLPAKPNTEGCTIKEIGKETLWNNPNNFTTGDKI